MSAIAAARDQRNLRSGGTARDGADDGLGVDLVEVRLISIIVPTLNEKETIAEALTPLQALRGQHVEIIVIDGGSADGTVELARPLADRVAVASCGRARQMNAGAVLARGGILLFLHADTRLPVSFVELIHSVLKDGHAWGRFDARIDSGDPRLRVVARMMNSRSYWSGIATGDQAMFVYRSAFERVGGFPDIPLMEDIALSKALRQLSRPACITVPVTTSSRRWEQHGVLRTIVLMWYLRFAYFCGADPAGLAANYGYSSDDE